MVAEMSLTCPMMVWISSIAFTAAPVSPWMASILSLIGDPGDRMDDALAQRQPQHECERKRDHDRRDDERSDQRRGCLGARLRPRHLDDGLFRHRLRGLLEPMDLLLEHVDGVVRLLRRLQRPAREFAP